MSPGPAFLPLTTRGRHLPSSWTPFPKLHTPVTQHTLSCSTSLQSLYSLLTHHSAWLYYMDWCVYVSHIFNIVSCISVHSDRYPLRHQHCVAVNGVLYFTAGLGTCPHCQRYQSWFNDHWLYQWFPPQFACCSYSFRRLFYSTVSALRSEHHRISRHDSTSKWTNVPFKVHWSVRDVNLNCIYLQRYMMSHKFGCEDVGQRKSMNECSKVK